MLRALNPQILHTSNVAHCGNVRPRASCNIAEAISFPDASNLAALDFKLPECFAVSLPEDEMPRYLLSSRTSLIDHFLKAFTV